MKLLISIILCCLVVTGLSQRLRYKDFAPLLNQMSPTEQVGALQEYIQYDLDNANANFRLALLHEQQYKSLDPLTQFEEAMAHAHESWIRYTKSKMLVTESDVRSNNMYYALLFGALDNRGKLVVEFPTIKDKIDKGYDSANNYINTLPGIYQEFTKSVNHYDLAVKLYSAINNKYKSEEDIYMLFNKTFDKELTILKQHYDSSLIHFKSYQELLTKYPLAQYNPIEKINSIETYRLDGLINHMTFLENEVIFWDYGQWADHIRSVVKNVVTGFLEKLNENEEKLSHSLIGVPGALEVSPFSIDKDLIYNLNNYDKTSLPLSLLKYKEFKQLWLMDINKINSDTTTIQKLDLYSALIHKNRMADSLLAQARSRITPINVNKHEVFLKRYYNGEFGVNVFLTNEQYAVSQSLNIYQLELKKNLNEIGRQPFNDKEQGKTLRFGSNIVPLFVADSIPTDLNNATLVTKLVQYGADGSIYLSGVHKPNRKVNNLQSYIARVNPDGSSAWFKTFNFSVDDLKYDNRNEIHQIIVTSEGVAAVCRHSNVLTGENKNRLLYLNDKGEVKVEKELPEKSFPRYLSYLESSNSFLLAFKGKDEIISMTNTNSLNISNINIMGDLLWSREIVFAGSLNKIIPVRDGYVIVGYYTSMSDLGGKSYVTNKSNGQTSPYLLKLSSKGNPLSIQPLETQQSLKIKNIYKINDKSVSLIVVESPIDSSNSNDVSLENSKLLMIDYNLKKICSEW